MKLRNRISSYFKWTTMSTFTLLLFGSLILTQNIGNWVYP